MDVDFIVQEGLNPLFAAAADRHFMRALRRHPRGCAGVLRIYECRGELLSLGRYNLAPPPGGEVPVGLCRRHCGGRALPFGDGFVGLSLILPHRSALFSSDPLHLAPHQVINRHVRGLLEACTAVGVAAFYPGRDLVTVGRRVLGAVSFETDERGTLLFEAVIANNRDFSRRGDLPASPEVNGGSMRPRVLPADITTCVAAQLGTRLSLAELAEELKRGFAKQFKISFHPRQLLPLEVQAIEALASRQLGSDQWLLERKRGGVLDHCGSVATQLGTFQVRLSLQARNIIKQAELAGEFIANSPAILELERDLRLCPLKWEAIEGVVRRIFSQPQNFILGVGRVRTIVDTILRGAALA